MLLGSCLDDDRHRVRRPEVVVLDLPLDQRSAGLFGVPAHRFSESLLHGWQVWRSWFTPKQSAAIVLYILPSYYPKLTKHLVRMERKKFEVEERRTRC